MDEVGQAINHVSALLEQQNAKLDAVLEHLSDMPKIQDFHRLERKVDRVEQRLGTVEAVLRATNRDIANLDQRVTRLETA